MPRASTPDVVNNEGSVSVLVGSRLAVSVEVEAGWGGG